MTQYLYVDFLLSFLGVCLYIFGLKKILFNDPKNYQGWNKMGQKKGMPIDIGIKRLSILKEKGLISDQIFSDSKELLFQSEMKISNVKDP